MRKPLPFALATLIPLTLSACGFDGGFRGAGNMKTGGGADAGSVADATSRAAAGAPERSGMTGTLQSGAVAVGGETTGWRLVGDGQTGGIEVDVSKVQDRAKALDGTRVMITGHMTERDWPERGKTQVLVAEKIEEAEPRKPE